MLSYFIGRISGEKIAKIKKNAGPKQLDIKYGPCLGSASALTLNWGLHFSGSKMVKRYAPVMHNWSMFRGLRGLIRLGILTCSWDEDKPRMDLGGLELYNKEVQERKTNVVVERVTAICYLTPLSLKGQSNEIF